MRRFALAVACLLSPLSAQAQFSTGAEVAPLLEVTRPNWIALREYDGKDWLYVTQLMTMRCGLSSIKLELNGNPPVEWPLIPCHRDLPTPHVFLDTDPPPAQSLPLNTVQTLTVIVTLDDGTVMAHSYDRAGIMTP